MNFKPNLKNICSIGCYILTWIVILVIQRILYCATLGAIKDAFGSAFVIALNVIGVIIFFSYVWCKILLKNRSKLKRLLPYALTALYMIGTICFTFTAEAHFEKFTAENWISHPRQRASMAFDLMEGDKLLGFTEQKVLNTLGEPDKIMPNDENEMCYIYYNGVDDGNLLWFSFTVVLSDGVVTSCHYSE